jgi:hypothetical protein
VRSFDDQNRIRPSGKCAAATAIRGVSTEGSHAEYDVPEGDGGDGTDGPGTGLVGIGTGLVGMGTGPEPVPSDIIVKVTL